MEPRPPALGAQSLSHWTTREVPERMFVNAHKCAVCVPSLLCSHHVMPPHKNGTEFAASSYKSKTYSITMAEYCHMREVYCVVTDENGNSVTTEVATMSRPEIALDIVSQPTSVEVAVGEKVTITVDAVGEGLTYQWYYKNKNGTTFAASSYKGKTYSITMASYCDMRQVYCVVIDKNGNTITSDIVTMSIAK